MKIDKAMLKRYMYRPDLFRRQRIELVPFGRLPELELAQRIDADRIAIMRGRGVFSDYLVKRWPDRASMARAVRRLEKDALVGDPQWHPVVPLRTTEGY